MNWELIGWGLALVIVAIAWLEVRAILGKDEDGNDNWPGGAA
jgi:hypothetical protein